jgi:hypothetical protein
MLVMFTDPLVEQQLSDVIAAGDEHEVCRRQRVSGADL